MDLSILKESTIVHLMFAITFFTSGVIMNFFQCLLYFGLRPLSKYFYRKIGYYLCYAYFSQLVCMAEWWSGSDFVLYAEKEDFEKYFGREHVLLLMNHRFEIDWLTGWVFCERVGVLGNCKAYAKKAIQFIPTLGWGLKFAESIFLERNWEKDKQIIGNQIAELGNYPDSIWLLLNAEGTRFTKRKLEASQKFSQEKGLPVLKYHLTPRTKGFTASVPHMRGKFPAIYDVQLHFNEDNPVKPTITNLLLGKRVEGHMIIRRIPLEEVPDGDEAAAEWLYKLYERKDRLAESFIKTGDFFAISGVPRLDRMQVPRRRYSLINTIFWMAVILVPMLYYLVKLFLSGSTIYLFTGVGILLLFYVLMQKTIGMSEISKSSSYGADDTKSK
ncbi:1-acyl-sn-glycerol-3-phosphate acyltransferase gamma-like [Hylaeus anthracinus]|uniref:1-acyl-sn-glycerol-3-phosphate acyltransferase gamma-like n=1 Tax=Hylaeus anthracinus TaxID=313031 RepID=UPI0023B9F65B|nr:1-acyl-sn-glycerol-3-phosphate acyltransferase gamma-like [Hylaeus anthracinus]XP_054011638.1 1-acyl-sn-glycerol-3-phosphate acyltransferase gamma-like [Hylaeus anthracinus]